MAASSSAALRRTSSTIACSCAMASRVAVCRAFTAWEQGGLSPAGAHLPCPGALGTPRSPAPPAPAARSPARRLTRGPRSAPGSPCGDPARQPRSRLPSGTPSPPAPPYPPLHVPEAADAQQRLLVGGEHDVGLRVQRCGGGGGGGGDGGEGSGQARPARPRPPPDTPHSLHFWSTSRLRWPRATMSWRANMRARCVSSRQRAHSGCPHVLQKYVVSAS